MKRARCIWMWGLAAAVAVSRALAADVQLYNTTYRPLSDVAAQYAMKLSWVTPEKTAQLKNSYCTMEFTKHERTLTLNGQPVALGAPIVFNNGMLYLAKRDYEKNILPLLSPQTDPNPPALRRIILDPGHGGKDSGAEVYAGGGTSGKLLASEKAHALDVALRLAKILQARGYQVLLTRTDDSTFDRKLRPLQANRSKGDLYISIHFNKADDTSVSGVETFILTPPWQPSSGRGDLLESDKVVQPGNRYDFWNTIVGFSIERAVTNRLQANNRGVKRARFDVLVPLNMPGLLIECGFLSNTGERAKIVTPAYRQTIAESIADGVDLYKKTLDRVRAPPPAAKTTANKGK